MAHNVIAGDCQLLHACCWACANTKTPTARKYPHWCACTLTTARIPVKCVEVFTDSTDCHHVCWSLQCTSLQVARAHKIPVIYDEVFTGCWRLGAPSAGSLLGQAPDIACYAKLLTGGVAPLAVTLASAEVFDAFKGASKVRCKTVPLHCDGIVAAVLAYTLLTLLYGACVLLPSCPALTLTNAHLVPASSDLHAASILQLPLPDAGKLTHRVCNIICRADALPRRLRRCCMATPTQPTPWAARLH